MTLPADFVFIDEVVTGIRWDAKYATWDNFTGKPVDGYFANRIVGSRALCSALEEARDKAASAGFGLLLWDAYRPQRAVEAFLRWSRQPEDGRTKPRHYPNIDRSEMFRKGYVAAKSGHSRGSTVDLTLYHLDTGELALMGGDHDLMDPISHHGAEGITPIEAANRQTLCSIMEDCGFSAYQCEWWHYTLIDEPYPHTYFDCALTSQLLNRTHLLTDRLCSAQRGRAGGGSPARGTPVDAHTAIEAEVTEFLGSGAARRAACPEMVMVVRSSLRPQGCPACSAPVLIPAGGLARCGGCNVLLRRTGEALAVDAAAARAELFAAADVCAGHWTLRDVLCGREVADADLVEAYRRLALAETGVAALVRLTP